MSLDDHSANPKSKTPQAPTKTPQESLEDDVWKFGNINEPLPHGLDSSGSKRISVGHHKVFPTNQIFLLSLSEFDKSFFSLKQKGVKQHYKDMVKQPKTKHHGSFHNGCMNYVDARDKKTKKWPLARHKQFHLFVELILKALQHLAAVPVLDRTNRGRGRAAPVDFSKELNGCGFLSTVRQVVQAPHIDAKWTTIDRHRVLAKKNNLPESAIAWKMIMSFVKTDNRMIFVHGVVGDPTFSPVPYLVNIPYKTVLLFRYVASETELSLNVTHASCLSQSYCSAGRMFTTVEA